MTEKSPRKAGNAYACVAILIGAAALLWFHPGAMDMDRLKANLLMAVALPLLLLARIGSGAARAPHARGWPAALCWAFGLPFCLLLAWNEGVRVSTESLGFALLLMILIVMARFGSAQRSSRFIPTTGLTAAGGIAAVYALCQVAGLDPFYLANPERDAVSTLGNTNELAEVMALLIPCALAGLIAAGKIERRIACGALPLLVAALWVSGGRAGGIAAAAGVAVFIAALYTGKRRTGNGAKDKTKATNEAQAADAPGAGWARPGTAILCVGLGLLLGGLLGSEKNLAFKRIESDASIFSADYPTNRARLAIWRSTLDLIKDHPLRGVGAGGFRSAFPPYRDPDEARMPGYMGARTEVRDPHNEYLWAMAEGGPAGLLCFLVFLALLFRHSLACSRGAGTARERIFSAGAGGTVCAFAILSLFRAPLHSPAAAVILFLIAGQILSVRPNHAQRTEADAAPEGNRMRRGFPGLLVGGVLFAGLLVLSCWIGGRGLASDWIAANTAVRGTIGLKEFERFRRAADIDPENLDIINFVGQTAANQLMGTPADAEGRYHDEAVRRLERVLVINPNHSGALLTLGRIKALDGDFESARDLIGRRSLLLNADEQPDEVIHSMLEAAGRHRIAARFDGMRYHDRPEILLERAKAFIEQETFERAQIYADLVLTVRPLDGDALHVLGKALKSLYGEGEDDAYRLMHIAYALDWIETGRWDEAAGSAKRSLRYGEGQGEAQFLQAVIAAAEGGAFDPQRLAPMNQAMIERLRAIAADGGLPEAVASILRAEAKQPAIDRSPE